MILLLCLLSHPGAPLELREIDAEIRHHPDRPELYLERAEYLRTLARFDDALADLDLAEALGSRVDGQRARIHEMRGATELAEHYATLALAAAPSAELYFLRSRVRTDRSAALADLRAALRFGPSVELYLAEGHTLLALGRRAEAANAFRSGADATGSIVLARELIRIAEPKEALDRLQVVLQRPGVKTDWLLLRAEVFARLGRPDEAKRDRERALAEAERLMRKRPAPAVLLSRARAYEALGRTEEAARDRREAEARWHR